MDTMDKMLLQQSLKLAARYIAPSVNEHMKTYKNTKKWQIFRDFSNGLDYYEVCEKYPKVTHETISHYLWEWKKTRGLDQLNPSTQILKHYMNQRKRHKAKVAAETAKNAPGRGIKPSPKRPAVAASSSQEPNADLPTNKKATEDRQPTPSYRCGQGRRRPPAADPFAEISSEAKASTTAKEPAVAAAAVESGISHNSHNRRRPKASDPFASEVLPASPERASIVIPERAAEPSINPFPAVLAESECDLRTGWFHRYA